MNSLLILLPALITLIAMVGIFLGLQMRSMQTRLDLLAYRLYFEVTRKADLLPGLIEKVAPVLGKERLSPLIAARAASAANNHFNADKSLQEETLWRLFDEIWREVMQNPVLQKDLVLVALKRDLSDADQRIEIIRNSYNQLVQHYNNLVGNPLLMWVSRVVKAKPANTF